MRNEVIIIGGLGNGSVIANAIEDAHIRKMSPLVITGFLNDRIPVGDKIEKYPVLGKLDDIGPFVREGYQFIYTILRIDGQGERLKIFNKLAIPEEQLAVFVHPTAYVAPSVKLGPGTVIMPNVSISSGTSFGIGCLVMVSATVGHDCKIGDFCHIAAQACMGAYLHIEKAVHIGLNASIRENLTIAKFGTVGMGAVLTKNIGEKEIWVGNPAKLLRKAD